MGNVGLAHVGGGDFLAHRPCVAGVVAVTPSLVPGGAAVRGGGHADGVGARVVVQGMLEREHDAADARQVDGGADQACRTVELWTPVEFHLIGLTAGGVGGRNRPVGVV